MTQVLSTISFCSLFAMTYTPPPDWLLNGLVKGFREVISDVVETKTKEAIVQQIEETIVNVNAYLADNPDLLLNVLAIDIDDLEENVVYL